MPRVLAGNRGARARRVLSSGLLFALLLLAACRAMPPSADTAVVAKSAPAGRATAETAPRFRVDPDASEIRLSVYRAGPLARFGHNHVIVGRMRGEIRAGDHSENSGFRLEIPVASFAIDPPAARVEEGPDFAEPVSGEARRATRENMLGQDVLDAAHQPRIAIDSVALVGPRWNPTVTARATLRGATRELQFPAAVIQQGNALTVVAAFRIRQSDFGLTPFATLGGGLQVRDAIDIRVRLVARRAN
jgi:polyisoprenoid-binding protein YceI